MSNMLPSDLLALMNSGMIPQSPVAYDTETSGLYPDDGAQTSTVSVAWVDYEGEWLDFANDSKFLEWNIEEYAPGQYAPVVSAAWPFDQGVQGKPEDDGQMALWGDEDNLPESEWNALLEWLNRCAQDEPGQYPPPFKTMLERERGLICHNALFDILMMAAGCRRFKMYIHLHDHIVWDTQVGNHLLWPMQADPDTGRPTTSLKPTSKVLFGTEADDEQKVVKNYLKKKRLPAGRWDLIPWSVIGSYAGKDARLTVMQYLRQLYEIRNGTAGEWFGSPERVLEMFERRMDTMRLLTRMEQRGLPYDEVGSRLAADSCLDRASRIELPFSPATDDAAKQYFFTDKGLDMIPYGLTDKGEPSLTAEILGRMVADKVPGAQAWAEYKKAMNAASMWYTAYADAMGKDGRLRTRYRQNGTASSRFSVERVNLQAIPQDYRLSSHSILEGIPTPRALIGNAVPEGWRLWELDLAQAELRVAAMFAGCNKMLDMIAADEDLHTYTTLELFPTVDAESKEFFKWRQVGKRGNFSLGFGSGGDTFGAMISKETGIVLGDALSAQIVRDWNRLYPEFGRAIDKHMDIVTRRQRKHGYGWVSAINGERRWWQKYEDAHKAFNQRVQMNLAQYGIDWMLRSDEYLRSRLQFDSHHAGLLLTIHDSQVLLLPDNQEGLDMAQQCAQFGKDLWKETFPDVPGDVDLKIWGEK